MIKRVIINGALGKMGTLACEILEKQDDFEIVGRLTKQDDLASAIKDTKAHIVIELTRADCVYQNSLIIINQGARPVIGASGLIESQVAELSALCQSETRGGVIAPNFSIGAILMMMFSAKAAEYFSEIEIIEAHHQQKLDAPSGTALKTAEMIAKAKKKSKNSLELKEIIHGVRGGIHHGINIHSIRLPGVLAHQQVIFGSAGETFTLSHNTIDRTCFMPGILLACQKVMALDHLVYGLEHLF